MPTPREEIYEGYLHARKQGVSAKQYLDIVAPTKRGRSESSASRYLRKLRTGERSGSQLYARAKKDAGKSVQVVASDEDDRKYSANVRVPRSGSRISLFTKPKTKTVVDYVREYSIAHNSKPKGKLSLERARSINNTPSGTKDIGKI
jgi:hypothetical protein